MHLSDTASVVDLESELSEILYKKTLQNFLDTLILQKLRRQPLGGYDLIGLIHKKFHILLSSGTIYASLYYLEREGLIKGEFEARKKVFRLTENGERAINSCCQKKGKVQKLLSEIFTEFNC